SRSSPTPPARYWACGNRPGVSMARARSDSRRKARPARKRRANELIDVTVLLLEDGYASTAIGPIEVFHSAGFLWHALRGETPAPRFRVRTASIDGRAVKSRGGVGLVPEFGIDDIKATDIVVLSASGLDVQERIAKHTKLLPWLRKMHAGGAQVAGICSGVAFLAEAGLLDDREATTHWAVADTLRQRYPRV